MPTASSSLASQRASGSGALGGDRWRPLLTHSLEAPILRTACYAAHPGVWPQQGA